MSYNNSIFCAVCRGIDFELANGFFYCQSCGTESHEHGQDFVYEEIYTEPSEFCEDSDSNDENYWKNDYPDEDQLESDNKDYVYEESTDEEKLMTLDLGESHFTIDTVVCIKVRHPSFQRFRKNHP